MLIRIPLAALALCLVPHLLAAQVAGVPERPLPDGPFVIDTAEAGQVRVTPMKGLELPWDLAFLPNGDMLVTERTAMRLRIVRNGVLEPQPITGLPEGMSSGGGGGLMAVAAHPRFAETGWVYLTYTKSAERGRRGLGLARGRLDGMALEDVRELFTVDEAGGGPPPGLPLMFAPDGYLYFFIGGANDEIAQRGDSYYGKVLRFNDDGSVPRNPFAGREGFATEIFTFGHRNGIGLTIHPTTGAVWQNENGPFGGDEVNILKARRELRLAARELRPRLQRRARVGQAHAGRRRGSGAVLGALDRDLGHDVLHGRSLPGVAQQSVRRRPSVRAHSAHGTNAARRLQRSSGRRFGARRCSRICGNAFATSSKARTDCCTC